MDVVPSSACPMDEAVFQRGVKEALAVSSCSIHLFGSQVGRKMVAEDGCSISMYQFDEAKKKIGNPIFAESANNQTDFKQFIWACPIDYSLGWEVEQEECIRDLRNNLIPGMVFTNVTSYMELVDDVRASLVVEQKEELDTQDTEVFFISNQLDEEDAAEAVDMLRDVVKIETLIIRQDEDLNYADMSVQQIEKSGLTVVYFKEASSWALSFAQQIWKMTGGASSNTPLLFIGDDANEDNRTVQFNAPKVVSKIVQGDLLPLEIKATYDKAIEGSI